MDVGYNGNIMDYTHIYIYIYTQHYITIYHGMSTTLQELQTSASPIPSAFKSHSITPHPSTPLHAVQPLQQPVAAVALVKNVRIRTQEMGSTN